MRLELLFLTDLITEPFLIKTSEIKSVGICIWTSAVALFFIVIVHCGMVCLASADSGIKNYGEYLTWWMIFLSWGLESIFKYQEQ